MLTRPYYLIMIKKLNMFISLYKSMLHLPEPVRGLEAIRWTPKCDQAAQCKDTAPELGACVPRLPGAASCDA